MTSFSIVVAFHNAQDNVALFYDRLKTVMEATEVPFEMVFVDDGSEDHTFKLLHELSAIDSRVTVVKLRRHFGKTAAIAAGFDHARGDCVISMEGDDQHDPADIPEFMAKMVEGYDIVSGWRRRPEDFPKLRQLPGLFANWLIAKLSGVHDFGVTFKAFRRELLDQVPLYGEMHRFITALASWHGATVCEIPIRHMKREHGVAQYGVLTTLRVLFDLLTIRFLLRYLSRPLHFFGTFGMLAFVLGAITGAYLFVARIFFNVPVMQESGALVMFAGVLAIAGIQLVAIGLLGEMLVRNTYEPRQRARYSVDRVLHASSEASHISD